MNISITIPQLFYDVIARVLPGFFFLFGLELLFLGTDIHLAPFDIYEDGNLVVTFSKGLGYVFVCYLLGWLLSAFVFSSLQKEIRAQHSGDVPVKGGGVSISEMFQIVRLKNLEAGFRIVKLRAEAKMLEGARTGATTILGVAVIMLLGNLSGRWSFPQVSGVGWLLRLLLPVVIAAALRKLESPAWHRYYGNITKLYELLVLKQVVTVEHQQAGGA